MQPELEQQLRQLSVTGDYTSVAQKRIDLDPSARSALQQHYAEFKLEMETDAQELKSQNQQKRLEAAKVALEHKIKRYCKENEQLESSYKAQKQQTAEQEQMLQKINDELEAYKQTEANAEPA